VEIRQLQYFKQVCKDRSLSRAAENLFITQQGLSHSIGKLEHELGVTLFVRTKNGVVPTDAAQDFIPDVDDLLASFASLHEKMKNTTKSARGVVRMAMTPGAIRHFAPRLVGEFSEIYPQIDILIKECPDGRIDKMLLTEESDLACTLGPIDAKALSWTRLFTDDVMVMMRHDNPLVGRRFVNISELRNEKFIMLPPEFKWHHTIHRLCREAGFEPHIAFTTWDINITFNLIHDVGAVGFLHRDIAQSFRTDENALVQLVPGSEVYWEMGLARKKARKLSYACDVVSDYIIETAANLCIQKGLGA
jgi:DNA-binding transcriptional LysR family regulator